MKNHSETFIDLNRKLYYLLWTFLLSFVGHVISYIFFNCQLNCSYIKGVILIIWFILGWARKNNLMDHSFIELKRNLSALNFSLFIYWKWLKIYFLYLQTKLSRLIHIIWFILYWGEQIIGTNGLLHGLYSNFFYLETLL